MLEGPLTILLELFYLLPRGIPHNSAGVCHLEGLLISLLEWLYDNYLEVLLSDLLEWFYMSYLEKLLLGLLELIYGSYLGGAPLRSAEIIL